MSLKRKVTFSWLSLSAEINSVSLDERDFAKFRQTDHCIGSIFMSANMAMKILILILFHVTFSNKPQHIPH
jgi:hypothetical protein